MAFSKARRLSDFIAADGTIPTGKFASSSITSSHLVDGTIAHADLHTDMDLTGKTVLVANASTGDSDTTAANTAFVQQEIAALVDSSPGTLNTLNELAAALGDDANFSTTVTNSIATKLPLAGGTLTGALISNSSIKTTGGIEIASAQPRLLLDRADGSYSWNIYNGDGTGNFPTSTFNIANNAGTAVITALDSGNVGIGVTNPTDKLHIGTNSGGTQLKIQSASSNNNCILHTNGTTDSWRTGMNLALTNGSYEFYDDVNNVSRMVLDSSGNVGIGNNDPNLPLTVTSNSGANALAIRARSADDYAFMQFYNHAGDTVRGQVYSHSTGNAVGISPGNSSSNGIKIDTEGLHFQRADGQSITAKESIVMKVDADNNTASRVFQVIHGNGKTLLNLHDDYRTEVGTLHYNSTRSAGATSQGSFSSSAGDWVDVATVPYGRNIATIKFWWDGLSAPGSAHHGLMEFDIGSHYGTSYYYGWDSYINLKTSSAHNSFYISEARIISPGGSGATGYFQVKFAVAVSTGTFRAYVTSRDEGCTITPMTPAVSNSRSGTTIAELKLGPDRGLVRNRVGMATSRDMHIGGGLTIVGQTGFNAYSPAVTSGNNTVIFGNTRHNIGSGYSTSTGRFTASTAGKYLFTFDVLMNSNSANQYGRVLFRVNGTGGTMEQYGDSLTYQTDAQSYFGLGLTCIISLNIGDYVEVYNAGQWSTYGTQYGVFCGHLLG